MPVCVSVPVGQPSDSFKNWRDFTKYAFTSNKLKLKHIKHVKLERSTPSIFR